VTTLPNPSSAPATLSDAELLRRYEPVLRFTQGEAYFPTDVDRYVANCSLWISHPNSEEECLIPRGQLTLEKLVNLRPPAMGAAHFLKFAELDALDDVARQGKAWQRANTLALQRGFDPGLSRLTRVGYAARLADAGISLSMLVRGRAPAETAHVAEHLTRQIQADAPRFAYYGRVVRDGGWVCLNYWFFYHYDDWRTGFDGVNDHEADWENLSVYLYESSAGCLQPEWVVFSCHDFTGNDLRRRWDDRGQLEIVNDTHPVAYVGGGSHAHYYRPGEYIIESAIGLLNRVEPAMRIARRAWRELFGDEEREDLNDKPLFVIPFVEYARGDGLSIGPGQQHEWQCELLDPAPKWLTEYRGMWGLFVRDPVGGENAPAGPMYNRDGSPRYSWYAPLGYAGLDSVPTPAHAATTLSSRRDALAERQNALEVEIAAKARDLQVAGGQLAVMASVAHLKGQAQAETQQVAALRAELNHLRREQAEGRVMLDALDERMADLAAGKRDDARQHINILQAPMQVDEMRFEWLAQFWSATSIGLLLAGIGLILFFTSGAPAAVVLGILVIAFLLIDSIFRRDVTQTATQIAIALAAITAVLLIARYWWQVLFGVVIIIGLFLIRGNLQALWTVFRAQIKS
jgi:hypothetical protein